MRLSAARKTTNARKQLSGWDTRSILSHYDPRKFSRGDGLFPPLRLVEWVRNETLQSLKIAPSICLRSSTEEVSFWKFLRDVPFSREETGLKEQRQTVSLILARYPPDDLNPSCRLIPYFSKIHSRLMSSLNHSRSLCQISRFAEREYTHTGKEV